MSDGMTDLAHSTRDHLSREQFLKALLDHMGSGGQTSTEEEAANSAIPYLGSLGLTVAEDPVRTARSFIRILLVGNKDAWVRLLAFTLSNDQTWYFDRLKSFSPFKDQILLWVRRSLRRLEIVSAHDLEKFLDSRAETHHAPVLGESAVDQLLVLSACQISSAHEIKRKP